MNKDIAIHPNTPQMASDGQSVGIEETPIIELAWEDLLARREAVENVMENLEAERMVINQEILARLKQEDVNGKAVGSWLVSVGRRVSVDIPKKKEEKERVVAVLKELGMLKLVEKVDTKMVEAAYNKGVELPCKVNVTTYAIVREAVELEA